MAQVQPLARSALLAHAALGEHEDPRRVIADELEKLRECSIRSRYHDTSVLASFLLLALQDGSASPPCKFDRVLPIEIAPTDPDLKGHGPSKRIDYTSDFSGTLHVWTKCDRAFDTFLRVEDEKGQVLRDEDVSRGKSTPYLKVQVEPGMKLVIILAESKPGSAGKVELHLRAAPETDKTREKAKHAEEELVEINGLSMAEEWAEARSRAEALIQDLVRVEGGTDSDLVSAQAWLAGLKTESQNLALLHSTESAWRLTLWHLTRTLPDDHLNLQIVRSALAGEIRLLGDLAGAKTLEEKVLAVYANTLPEDDTHVQVARSNYATTLQELGDFQGALAQERGALEIESKVLPDDDPNLQRTRANLAISYSQLGRPKEARELLEKVSDVFTKIRPDDDRELQIVRTDLAVVLDSLGEAQAARALKEKVLKIYLKTLPDDHPNLQLARQNMGCTLESFGDLEQAHELYEKVLEVQSRTLPPNHPNLQLARCNVAISLAHRERDRMRGGKEKAVEENRKRFSLLVADYLNGMRGAALQTVLGSSGREAEERAVSGHALDLPLSLARGYGVFSDDGALEKQAFLLSESTRNVALFSARLARAAHSDRGWKDLLGRIREATSRMAELGQSGGDPKEFDKANEDLNGAQRDLVKLGGLRGGRAIAALRTEFDTVSSQLGEHDGLVGYRSYNRWAFGDAGPEDVTANLCAFVVRSGGKLTRVELGPIEPIEKAVEVWRAAVGVQLERGAAVTLDAQSTLITRGSALRRLVFDPLHDALAGVNHIVVALDVGLHLIQLDALPAGDVWGPPVNGGLAEHGPKSDSTLLGDQLHIEVALNLLLDRPTASATPAAPAGTLLALGSPHSDGSPIGPDEPDNKDTPAAASPQHGAKRASTLRPGAWERSFPTLPATHAEVQGIQTYYDKEFGKKDRKESELKDGAIVLEQRRASRDSLVSLAPKARFLHVAAHGWFAPESIRSSEDPQPIDAKMNFGVRTALSEQVMGMSPMLLCGLALAGANLPEDEIGRIPGLITAQEVSTLELSNCELAVLSACDTNGGVRRAGQGVASLQKALHMAGARSVITSLWDVPDEATKTLMLDFYHRLWVEKKPKSLALWEAKMKLRKAVDESGRPKYSTHDWAAWVLTGDPN